jgi:hypothetical protein
VSIAVETSVKFHASNNEGLPACGARALAGKQWHTVDEPTNCKRCFPLVRDARTHVMKKPRQQDAQ